MMVGSVSEIGFWINSLSPLVGKKTERELHQKTGEILVQNGDSLCTIIGLEPCLQVGQAEVT